MGLFDFLKGINKQQQKEESVVKFDLSIKTESNSVERFLAPKCDIPVLELSGYVSPSGGYVNWIVFEVTGINPKTGRINKRIYEARKEQEALDLAEKEGLQKPEIKKVLPIEPPTENQIGYLESWGITVPDGACKYDVSAILSRLEDSDDVVNEIRVSKGAIKEYIRPLEGPNEDFAMFAHEMGLHFSKFIGADALHRQVVCRLEYRDKAAFFAYCVMCNNSLAAIGNMLESPQIEQIYAFADEVLSNESLMRSIVGRAPEDYLNPHKGSMAYKAVAEYFNL